MDPPAGGNWTHLTAIFDIEIKFAHQVSAICQDRIVNGPFNKIVISSNQRQSINYCRGSDKPIRRVLMWQTDFTASHGNFVIECGFVKWHRAKDAVHPIPGGASSCIRPFSAKMRTSHVVIGDSHNWLASLSKASNTVWCKADGDSKLHRRIWVSNKYLFMQNMPLILGDNRH